jgi:hypothetical protein
VCQVVTSARIAVDVKHIASRRESLDKPAVLRGTMPSLLITDAIPHTHEDNVLPRPQEWDPTYVVVANSALYMGEYNPSIISGRPTGRQACGKFTRVMGLKDATIRFVEHNSSVSGFVLRVKAGGGLKRMFLCPPTIKGLLEWGAVIQQVRGAFVICERYLMFCVNRQLTRSARLRPCLPLRTSECKTKKTSEATRLPLVRNQYDTCVHSVTRLCGRVCGSNGVGGRLPQEKEDARGKNTGRASCRPDASLPSSEANATHRFLALLVCLVERS